MRTLSFSVIVPVLGIVTAMAQVHSAAQPYDEPDAYQIYSLLIPHEESYVFAQGTLIIQEETVSDVAVTGAGLSREVASRFKDAASDYERARTKKWFLQRQFMIEKTYEIVNRETIARLETSEQPRPKSGGHIFMSPVGFNRRKTQAIVYAGSSCGGLCGSSQFHLFEKVHGRWKEVSGVSIVTVS